MSKRTAWVRRRIPTVQKRCYRTKANALNMIRDYNRGPIEEYGGETYNQSPAEFDAINHKYGLVGKRRVRNIAEAMWVAMPGGRPFCLDEFDYEAMNDTDPGKIGAGFMIPDFAIPIPKRPRPAPRSSRPKTKAPPRDWRKRCKTWQRQEVAQKKLLGEDCFLDRNGVEKCVCRRGGRFVSCTPGGYVPGVPF